MSRQVTPAQFIAKWLKVTLSERAASQEHFIDLCHMLSQPTPVEHDPTGTEYAFEKGVAVTDTASRSSHGELRLRRWVSWVPAQPPSQGSAIAIAITSWFGPLSVRRSALHCSRWRAPRLTGAFELPST